MSSITGNTKTNQSAPITPKIQKQNTELHSARVCVSCEYIHSWLQAVIQLLANLKHV